MCSLTIGLAALQGYSNFMGAKAEGDAQEAMYKAQARNAEMNAEAERRQQERIADKYAQDQMMLDDKRRLAHGQIAAGAGASGMTMTGSGLDILSSSEEAWKKDSMNLLQNQRYDNEASRAQETNYMQSALNSYSAAANAKRASRQKQIGSILGAASSIYGAYDAGKTADTAKDAATSGAVSGDWADTYDFKAPKKQKYGWGAYGLPNYSGW